MKHLVAALEALLAAAAAPPLKPEVPDSALPQVLPTVKHVQAAKRADRDGLAAGFTTVLEFELVGLVKQATELGVIDLARTIGPFAHPPAPTQLTDRDRQARVDVWEHRLHLTDGASELVDQIVAGAAPATIATAMVAATDTETRAEHFRDALDVLSRWVAAARAAATFGGQPVIRARVLTLYRVEADLAVPRSQRSLAALVPAHTESVLQPVSAGFGKVLYQLHNNSLVRPANRTESGTELGVRALHAWLLHVGGHDLLVSGHATIADFAQHWTAADAVSPLTEAQLQARLAAVAASMAVTRARTIDGRLVQAGLADVAPPRQRIRVTPVEPVELVELALELGFALLDHFSRAETVVPGVSPAVRWSPELAYLLYNNQIQPFTRRIPHLGILGSAVGASASWPGYREPTDPQLQAPFAELRAALRAVEPSWGVWEDPSGMTPTDVALFNQDSLGKWLTEPGADVNRRAALLSLFAARADSRQWTSFGEHRANTSRFRLLRSYYEQVLGV